MLKEIARRTKERTGTTQLSAEDYMDDGAKLCLTVNINEEEVGKVIVFIFSLIIYP